MRTHKYDALPNWMNPEKLRRIEKEFYGVKRHKHKSKEELLRDIYVYEGGREKAEA